MDDSTHRGGMFGVFATRSRLSAVIGAVAAVIVVAGAAVWWGMLTMAPEDSIAEVDAGRKGTPRDAGRRPSDVDVRANDVFRVEAVGEVGPAGVWAERTVQTTVADVPVVGRVEGRTEIRRRLVIERRSTGWIASAELCDVSISSESAAVRTTVPDAFVETDPVEHRPVRFSVERGRLRLHMPETCGVRGFETDEPEESELPETPSDPAVVDGDDDGRPGVTIRVDGTISGRLALVQRGCDAYRGRFESPDVVRGRVEWSTRQRVLRASNLLLEFKPTPRPHPDPDESRFAIRRIGESSGCEAIAARSPEWFRGGETARE